MDTSIYFELAETLRVPLQPSVALPPRIELSNTKTHVRLVIQYFADEARLVINLDSTLRPRRSFIASMSVRGVESVDLDRSGNRVLFRLDSGEVLTIYADARFTRGTSAT